MRWRSNEAAPAGEEAPAAEAAPEAAAPEAAAEEARRRSRPLVLNTLNPADPWVCGVFLCPKIRDVVTRGMRRFSHLYGRTQN